MNTLKIEANHMIPKYSIYFVDCDIYWTSYGTVYTTWWFNNYHGYAIDNNRVLYTLKFDIFFFKTKLNIL